LAVRSLFDHRGLKATFQVCAFRPFFFFFFTFERGVFFPLGELFKKAVFPEYLMSSPNVGVFFPGF